MQPPCLMNIIQTTGKSPLFRQQIESHEAKKERDGIDKKLDAKQRQEAQELSRKCSASNFTDC